ncbi:MAG: tetratricopeptide repeat protein [Polyangiaceae bacterium]
MKSSRSRVVLCFSGALLLLGAWGCENEQTGPGPVAPTPAPRNTYVPVSGENPEVPLPPSPIASTAPTFNPKSAPPPRPTTIKLARSGDEPGKAQLDEGDTAFEKGDLAAARKAYEAARKAAPKKPAPAVGLARVKIAATDLPLDYAAGKGNRVVLEAVRDLKAAAKLDAEYGPAQVELGRALLLAGDADGALTSLREGVRLLPEEPEAHSALGIALLATGSGDKAIAPMAKAVQLDPGSPARHGNYGTVLLMQGQVKEAVAAYESQVAFADNDAKAHSDLGTALLAANDIPRATKELERAVALDPKRATFRSNLGFARQSAGKLAEAQADYEQATKLDPQLASAWINLATVLSKDKSTRKRARDALETAKKIDPTDPRVKANLEELDDLEKKSP